MKLLNIFFAAVLAISFASCKDDDNEHTHEHEGDTTFEYHAHITSPNANTKTMGDVLSIKIDFESHTGETVHNINVIMYDASDETVIIFDEPGDAHIHSSSGEYLFEKELELTTENGVKEHTDYVIKASVWGSEDGQELEVETVTFHVHEG